MLSTMPATRIDTLQHGLEAATRRWWFIVGILVVQITPPFASREFALDHMYDIVNATLNGALIYGWKPAYPVFQSIAIAMIVLVVLFRNSARRLFCLYAGLSYIMFAVAQLMAVTPRYGVSVVLSGVVVFILVAATWFWEAFAGRCDLSIHASPGWKITVIPVAAFAFWMPMDLSTFGPAINVRQFVASGSALTFCMMTPVYLAVMIFFHPRVNTVTLRVTSLVGGILGLAAMPMFFTGPRLNAVMHVPLLVLSIIGLLLTTRIGRGSSRDGGCMDQLPVGSCAT